MQIGKTLKGHIRGFSLIEILIVIAIIGVLASVIMPAINKAREKGLEAATLTELNAVRAALTLLYDATGLYPNGDTSVCRASLPANNEVDLSTDAAGLVANGSGWSGWQGPYITEVTDPWGNPYYLDEDYQCMAETIGCKGVDDTGTDSSVLVSCGPNGAISGSSCDYDADNIVLKLCD